MCSKLSFLYEWVCTLFSNKPSRTGPLSDKSGISAGEGALCCKTNQATSASRDRVKAFSKECPNCLCEKFKTSPYSPGIIQDGEKLTRFVFSPVHLDRKGTKIKPSVFSHVFTVGCSIQRESLVSDEELISFVKGYLAKNSTHSWFGTLTADCTSLRNITLDDTNKRIMCVYDMAEKDNPAHGEIHQSQYEIEETDQIELRAKLFEAFNSGNHVVPAEYRSGTVLKSLG